MSVGTVQLRSNSWRVTCQPQVRARIRRCFPRVQQTASDFVDISDTAENCRDLLWFMGRYPLTIESQDLARMQRQSEWHAEQERQLEALLSSAEPPAPAALALPAREYQLFAAQLLELKRGLLLADDLGGGKTVSAIVPMATAANIPALVVCPPHLTRQWEREVQRFLPARWVYRIRTGKVRPLTKQSGQHDFAAKLPDVIIVSYHMLRTWAESLAPFIKYVAFDECQQLRHDGTLISAACDHVAEKAALRIGLSATPIYNYGSEFFPVVNTLQPGCLGTREEFLREWCTPAPGGHSRIKDTADFGAYLRREGIMLRRTRKDMGREIPDLSRVVHTIDCDLKLLNKLEGAAIALAKVILQSNEQHRGQHMQASGEFDTLMRQATGLAKAPYVAEFVRLLLENGEPKIVVFAWHREVYKILLERLREFKPMMYTGSESTSMKAQQLAGFIEGPSRVLLMSLRSGAGVDGLQANCRTAVFAELDWSPGVHEQCMGRIHRDGQSDPVSAYFLLSEAGTDPIVSDVVGLKREQIEGVRNPDSALAEITETGEHHLRQLARNLLERHGQPVPGETPILTLRPQEVEA